MMRSPHSSIWLQHRLLVEIAELGLQRDVAGFQDADLLQQPVDHLVDAADRQIGAHGLERHVVGAGLFLDQVAVVALGAAEFQALGQAALEARVVEVGSDLALVVAGVAAAQEAEPDGSSERPSFAAMPSSRSRSALMASWPFNSAVTNRL